METTRPTISIKNHLNGQSKQPSKAAINGILKRGNAYKFTKYKHEEILAILDRVKEKTGLNGRQFSMALGYGDTAYKSWSSGARFSRKSYLQVMQKASELNDQCNQQGQLSLPMEESKTMTDEQMIAHLKSKGYRIHKPVTTYEEI